MDGSNSNIRIREISDAGELKIVEELAWKIFPKTYADLIPAEQTPYMMRIMYDDAVLRKEFAEGMHFVLITDAGTPIGYICWHLSYANGVRIARLEKLYLDFAYHGRSIGNMGINYVIDAARRTDAAFITLNVNKGNIRAQKAYCRAGFYRYFSEKEEVGGGFFKDDYVMRYDLAPQRSINQYGFTRVADVVPEALFDLRYCSENNFVGTRIDGYEAPVALLTVAAAEALKEVAAEAGKAGYKLKIYDAYRPARAVAHFLRWAQDPADTRMKASFYPGIDKSEIIPGGYIAARSAHSRGSTVDLTLCDSATGEELDMGGAFDRFGPESRPAWCGDPETGTYTGKLPDDAPAGARPVTAAQFRNRMLLREAMVRHGFVPIATEWWHFILSGEPYEDTYFDFPVK